LDTSSHTHLHFNLQDLIQSHDLQGIATPFTKKDINDTIKNMPFDKALGLMDSMESFSRSVGT
jgi:hypothetical protein